MSPNYFDGQSMPNSVFRAGFTTPQYEQPAQPPVKLLVWGHDPFSSEYDVFVDMAFVPQAQEGDLAELTGRDVATGKPRKLFFILRPKPDNSNAQISVNTNILTTLGIQPRSTVDVCMKAKEVAQIDQVGLHFKGTHLSRADLYKISKQVTGQCLRVGQRVSYLGGLVRLTVEAIYRNGKKRFSGYVGSHTRLVYRSGSARLLLLIQISAEMWDFDETGDVAFHKLVNAFIPETLRQFLAQGDQHAVSIIFFTSVSTSHRKTRLLAGELEDKCASYYRVVVDQLPISRWSDILQTLRAEFAQFNRDVLLSSDGRLTGTVLPSSKGNILEALSLATTFASHKFSDRDLCRTNLQAVIITPSPGLFDVAETELYRVSRAILNVEMSIQLVCLTRPPLHITPMFRAENRFGDLQYYIPTWMNVSFFNTPERYVKQWLPRCKIYDIQMMGVMENEMKAISVRNLAAEACTPRFMRSYDTNVFKSAAMLHDQRKIEEAVHTSASSTLLRPTDTISPSHVVSESTNAVVTITPVAASPPASTSKAVDNAGASSARTTLDKLLQKRGMASSLRSLARKTSTGSFGAKIPFLGPTASPASTMDHGRPRSISQNGTTNTIDANSQGIKPLPIPNSGTENPGNTLSVLVRGPKVTTTSPVTSRKKQTVPGMLSVPVYRRKSADDIALARQEQEKQQGRTWKAAHKSMWRMLKNPSILDTPSRLQEYGRWANIYAPGTTKKLLSWVSLNSPASLPLTTEQIPTVSEWQNEYKFQFYDLAVGLSHESVTAGQLLDEMIGLRLQMGFQISVGDNVLKIEEKLTRGDASMVTQVVPKSHYTGLRVYMVREGVVHRLLIEQDGLINVQIYTWEDPDQGLESIKNGRHPVKIRTKFDTQYHPLEGEFYNPLLQFDISWNRIDQQLAGFDEFSSSQDQYFITIRFVLIPTPDFNKLEAFPANTKLNIEEVRLEGIRKVLSTLLRHRYYSEDKKQRGQVAPDIFFYTGKLENALKQISNEVTGCPRTSEFFQRDRLNKSIKLSALADEICGKNGLPMGDRRWHWKTYHSVIVGVDLVKWLTETFSDISTPEEAVEYGSQLMEKKFLVHVDGRHVFMDGHFFYQLGPEYARASFKDAEPKLSQKKLGIEDVDTTSAVKGRDPKDKERIVVSRSFPVDIDPKHLSDRQELIHVHVDKIHNPENAFNIKVDWLNATQRLIEEFFMNISRLSATYGLRLVQVPVSGISESDKNSPFRSAQQVTFVLNPATFEFPDSDTEDPLETDELYYHDYFLKRMGFVFDATDKLIENEDLKVAYSWDQVASPGCHYLHHTGAVLVDILQDKSFLVLSNTIQLSRLNTSTSPAQATTGEVELQEWFRKVCNNVDVLTEVFISARKAYSRCEGSISSESPTVMSSPKLEAIPEDKDSP